MELKVDWCSHEAAKHACLNWHYSRSIPVGKLVKLGAWENERFIGAIIFSRGANSRIGEPYNLGQTEVCELTRVALRAHKEPVTKILTHAIKMLKQHCQELRLIVSYADLDQGHTGTIYQAGNWLYVGTTLFNSTDGSYIINGKREHGRTISSRYGGLRGGGTAMTRLEWLKLNVDPNAEQYTTKGKHKYLMHWTKE